MGLYNTQKNNEFLLNRDTVKNLSLCDPELISMLLNLWVTSEFSIRTIRVLVDQVRIRKIEHLLSLNKINMLRLPGMGVKTENQTIEVIRKIKNQRGIENGNTRDVRHDNISEN